MQQITSTLLQTRAVATNTYEWILEADTTGIRPGQFVQIQLEGFYLRRPISVCNVEGDRLTLVFKVVGKGTRVMQDYPAGTKLDLLTGLGNGYDLTRSGDTPLLVGGGVGVPPLYLLCRELVAQGKKPSVILGFNRADEVFYADEFAALGVPVQITTVDGSMGVKGFVTDALPAAGTYSYFYSCGPEPMLRALSNATATSGQLSFEERMACGFGACMGCTCKTKYGHKRICKDGPVLEKEEVIW